ncbi:SAM-dependent methyltransferase [Actinomadura sp. SCN-SB]|uniref:SAM-dependent methyltransferase n=1 Tax=Actinomadura sp. SCN-SB TaxID=3373092 RepID=UPI003752F1B5
MTAQRSAPRTRTADPAVVWPASAERVNAGDRRRFRSKWLQELADAMRDRGWRWTCATDEAAPGAEVLLHPPGGRGDPSRAVAVILIDPAASADGHRGVSVTGPYFAWRATRRFLAHAGDIPGALHEIEYVTGHRDAPPAPVAGVATPNPHPLRTPTMTTDNPADVPLGPAGAETVPLGVDPSVPHKARVYDCLLGGKDNFAADRALADRLLKQEPRLRAGAQANRSVLVRAVRTMAAELEIRQFLDLGTGLPTRPNVHEVVQEVAPACRVVYVDNDPMVLVHARALLTSSPEGTTTYVDADLRNLGAILEEAAKTLNFDEPIGVTAAASLHFLTDEEIATALPVLRQPLASGSALAISHVLTGLESVMDDYRASVGSGYPRTPEQVKALFDGWSLIPPGLVEPDEWRPGPDTETDRISERASMADMVLCGVAVLGERP